VEDAYAQAEESGKKLLILAGENHYHRGALLVEYMLVDIAGELGIRTFVDEIDETKAGMKAVNIDYWNEEGFGDKLPDRSTRTNIPHLRKVECWTVINGDPASGESDQWNWQSHEQQTEYREMFMIEELAKLESHPLAIYGANHLKGLTEGIAAHDAGDEFLVLPLNVSQTIAIPNRARQSNPDESAFRQLWRNDHAIPVLVPGKALETGSQARTMAEAAIEAYKQRSTDAPEAPENSAVARLEARRGQGFEWVR